MRDSNPRHPVCKAESDPTQQLIDPQVASPPSSCCTSRCTEDEDRPNADPLADLVANLTPADRARLVAMLTGQREGDAAAACLEARPPTTGKPGEETEP
jgi:hypothetical protein